MRHIESQQQSLGNIQSPEEAIEFMEASGVTPEDIENMMKASNQCQDEEDTAIGRQASAVDSVAAKISDLVTEDSDDEDEAPTADEAACDASSSKNGGGSKEGTGSNDKVSGGKKSDDKQRDRSEKKERDAFAEAFKKNQFNNAIKKPKKPPPSSIDSSSVTALSTIEYSDTSFKLLVELPGVQKFSDCDLKVSQTSLKLAANAANNGNGQKKLKLEILNFEHDVDTDTIAAKFSKKKNQLEVTGLLM